MPTDSLVVVSMPWKFPAEGRSTHWRKALSPQFWMSQRVKAIRPDYTPDFTLEAMVDSTLVGVGAVVETTRNYQCPDAQ
jgi:hypothetical protein